MKNLIASFVFIIIATYCFGQQNYLLTSGLAFDNFGNKASYEKELTIRKKNKIASERSFRVNSKGEQVLTSETSFDKNGNWIEKSYFNKKGNLKYKWSGTCNDAGKYTESKREKPDGKVCFYSQRTFDQNNNLLSFIYKQNGVKVISRASFVYNNDNLCTESVYAGRNPDKFRKFVFTYYEDGKNKETVQYDHKGKEKHRWSYNCDPEGKELSNKESEVCKKSDVDEQGNRTEVYLYNDKKQKIRKVVIVYDKNDNKLSSTRYKKSGKQYNSQVFTYDESNNQLTYNYYRCNDKKAVVMLRYQYDTNSNRIKREELKRNLSVRSSYTSEYKTF